MSLKRILKVGNVRRSRSAEGESGPHQAQSVDIFGTWESVVQVVDTTLNACYRIRSNKVAQLFIAAAQIETLKRGIFWKVLGWGITTEMRETELKTRKWGESQNLAFASSRECALI